MLAQLHADYIASMTGAITMQEAIPFTVIGVPFIMAFFFLFVWNLAPIIEWCVNKLVDFLVNL